MKLEEFANRLDEFTGIDYSKFEKSLVSGLNRENFPDQLTKHPEWDVQKIKDEFWKIALDKENVSLSDESKAKYREKMKGKNKEDLMQYIINSHLAGEGLKVYQTQKRWE